MNYFFIIGLITGFSIAALILGSSLYTSYKNMSTLKKQVDRLEHLNDELQYQIQIQDDTQPKKKLLKPETMIVQTLRPELELNSD